MSSADNNRRSFLKTSALAAAALVTKNISAQAFSEKIILANENLILPPRLKSGDVIALTAPAGAIFNDDSIQKATVSFESQGFRVLHGKTLSTRFGYLAGTDSYRGKELNDLFDNTDVKGIVAMRGGYGCARLLNFLDFNKIIHNPKVFSGFSDITVLLHAIYVRTGLITFHGPVGNSTLDGFTMEHFLRIVKDGEALKMQQPSTEPLTVISEGKVEGKLFGGNLSVWSSMIGTGYLPDTTSSILFFEETEEEPYQVDRLLTQLEIIGILARASGIVFGRCSKCEAEKPEESFTIDEVLQQKFGKLTIPVSTGFNFGHIKDKFTFPIGANVIYDTSSSSLELTHACVS